MTTPHLDPDVAFVTMPNDDLPGATCGIDRACPEE